MEDIFVKLLNMSITASYVVIAVLIMRLILKRAPKKFICLLWSLVAFRLICPYSFESHLSLIPSAQPIAKNFIYAPVPNINSGISWLNHAVNPILENTFAANDAYSANPMQITMSICCVIWLISASALIIYGVFSYFKLKLKVSTAVPFNDNIFKSDQISSPFVLGFFKPRIYIPFDIDARHMPLVTAHENAHIKRGDHWFKLVAFALLCIYWFNPFVWLSYYLFCRDLEASCDERVIDKIGVDKKKDYSLALLYCSTQKKAFSMCPLAFGITAVKQRVKNILNYKKPAFWIVIGVAAAIVVLSVCLISNPNSSKSNALPQENDTESYANFAYGDLLYTHSLSSYLPTGAEMPYFRITKDTFGAVPDRYGSLSHTIEPFFQYPIYAMRSYDPSIFEENRDYPDAARTLKEFLDGKSNLKMLEVFTEDSASTGYYVIYNESITLLAYRPDTINCFVISLEKL